MLVVIGNGLMLLLVFGQGHHALLLAGRRISAKSWPAIFSRLGRFSFLPLVARYGGHAYGHRKP